MDHFDYLKAAGWTLVDGHKRDYWQLRNIKKLYVTTSAVAIQRKIEAGETRVQQCQDCRHWFVNATTCGLCWGCSVVGRRRSPAPSKYVKSQGVDLTQDQVEFLEQQKKRLGISGPDYFRKLINEAMEAALNE